MVVSWLANAPKTEQPGRCVVVPNGGAGGVSTPAVTIGSVLAGKYRVERVLGAGGMGQVFQATHLGLDQWVAIKCLLPDASSSETSLARFQREARISAKIKSEHIARTLDVGQLPGGGPYIVMEYLQGCDLDQLLGRVTALPAERAVTLVLQASEALAEAHALGIVHRDLKLANLFLTQRADGSDCIKVLDFGISKLQAESAALTRSAAFMGSPRYMSPEQLNSARDVDARTDIWALGVVLYFLLSGSAPFSAVSLPDLVYKISRKAPAPLGSLAPGVAPSLVAVVERCLRKDPADRFRSVGELARALAPFGDENCQISAARISAVLAEPWSDPAPACESTQQSFARAGSASPPPTPWSSRLTRASLSLGIISGVVVLTLLLLVARWWLGESRRSAALEPLGPGAPGSALTSPTSISALHPEPRAPLVVPESAVPAASSPPASNAPAELPRRVDQQSPRRSLPRVQGLPAASATSREFQSLEPNPVPAEQPTLPESKSIDDLYRDRH